MNVVSIDLLGQKNCLMTNSFKGTSGIESAPKSEKFIQLVHSPRPPKKRNFYLKKILILTRPTQKRNLYPKTCI